LTQALPEDEKGDCPRGPYSGARSSHHEVYRGQLYWFLFGFVGGAVAGAGLVVILRGERRR